MVDVRIPYHTKCTVTLVPVTETTTLLVIRYSNKPQKARLHVLLNYLTHTYPAATTYWLCKFHCLPHMQGRCSLVPRPRPAFCCLQYRKAWYLFSREHDIIRNFQNKQAGFCVLFNRLHTQRSVYTTIVLR